MTASQDADGINLILKGILYEFLAALFALIGLLTLFVPLIGFGAGLISFAVAFALAIIAVIRLFGGFSRLEGSVPNASLGMVGVILAIIPFIVNIIGYIFLGIAIYSIGSKYSNGVVEVGGILTAIPMVNFIGLIVSYVGLKLLLDSQALSPHGGSSAAPGP